MSDQSSGHRSWGGFWARGTWWKALIVAVVYLAIYEGAGLIVLALWRSRLSKDLLASPESVFLGLTFGLIVGAVVLTVFVASLRWFGPLFRRQGIRGRGWMWIAVVLTVVPILLRFAGIDYGRFGVGVVLVTFASGLLIGFTEELLTRGIAVKLLREAGHGEKAVAVMSSVLFALLHSVNALSGQPVLTVLLTLVYAFGFGMMMYLVLRVTGSLIWPMLIHALTDPTTILATGGIDATVPGAAAPSPLLALAGPFNIIFIIFGIVAVFLIRGRMNDTHVVSPIKV